MQDTLLEKPKNQNYQYKKYSFLYYVHSSEHCTHKFVSRPILFFFDLGIHRRGARAGIKVAHRIDGHFITENKIRILRWDLPNHTDGKLPVVGVIVKSAFADPAGFVLKNHEVGCVLSLQRIGEQQISVIVPDEINISGFCVLRQGIDFVSVINRADTNIPVLIQRGGSASAGDIPMIIGFSFARLPN